VKRRIAFFDFDGTVTTKDTLLEFIKHSRGTAFFYFGFLLNSPYMVAFKLKLISNQLAKEKVLQFFFKNMPVATFEEKCESFSRQEIAKLLRPKAIEEIEQLKRAGATVVIVSASPENWIREWSESLGLQLLGTKLTTREDRITGKITGINCHGKEKVRRINEVYNLSDYDEILAYGDSKADKPMLGLASVSYYKPFR
jgi:HAD superfamily hydrolase (TIGR01490 family)